MTATTRFDEQIQEADWQKEVAKELNILMDRLEIFGGGLVGIEPDQKAIDAILSIVERVADFEEIQTYEQTMP